MNIWDWDVMNLTVAQIGASVSGIELSNWELGMFLYYEMSLCAVAAITVAMSKNVPSSLTSLFTCHSLTTKCMTFTCFVSRTVC